MKKTILSIVLVGVMLNCIGCSDEHTPENCPDVYEEGQKDAVKTIMEEAEGDLERYVEIEELEKVMREYFGDKADEIRDMIIYDADLEKYDRLDIIEEVINDSGLYY